MSSFDWFFYCIHSIYILIIFNIPNLNCLDNVNNITYANLNLTFQKTNENLYFNKGGVYSRDSDKSPINGMLHLVSTNNLNEICLNNSVIQHVALIELKEIFSPQNQYIRCFNVAIWITVSDNDFLSGNKQFKNSFASSLMVSNSTGKRILESLSKSPNDTIIISILAQDSSQFRDLSPTSLAFIIIGSVVIVFIVSCMWALFYKIQKNRRIDDRELFMILMLKLTKKAISKMKSKKLKNDDPELASGEICMICLDNYKVDDSIRTLPCLHQFHKDEIETWLLENQTCPICKIDILKAYDLDIRTSSGFFRRQLERLNLIQSPLELSEAILNQADTRRNTLQYTRRSTIFSNMIPSILNDSAYNTQRNLLFFGEYGLNFDLTISNADDPRPRTTQLIGFFGENMDDIMNQQIEENTNDENDDDSNRSKLQLIVQEQEIKPQIISTSRFSQHLPTIKSSESFCPDNNNNDNFLFDDPEPVPCKKKFTVVYVDEAATSTGLKDEEKEAEAGAKAEKK